MERGVLRTVFSKIAGIVVFLLILGFLNFLTSYLRFEFFVSGVGFLNRQALLIVTITLIFIFAEISSKMEFPSNVFSPVLSFIGIWLILNLFFLIIEAIEIRLGLGVTETLLLLKLPVYIAVLGLSFLFGTLPILYKILKNIKPESGPTGQNTQEELNKPLKKETKTIKKRRKNVKRRADKRN